MILLALLCAAVLSAAPGAATPAAADPAPPAPPPSEMPAPPPVRAVRVAPQPTPVRLFASAEEAWSATDAERLASLVDTTRVRIALKPDAPPTTALTRGAATFLFEDPMRLVRTKEFRILRVEVSDKGTARAQALWVGDWGGRLGVRRVRVLLTAGLDASGWLLTEVRASD